MRRLKLQVQTTVDGFMAGPDGAMDWMSTDWSDDVGSHVEALMEGVDHMILGRRLAEGFIPHWLARPEWEPEESIDWMNATPKTVVTTTLAESPWDGVALARDPVGAVEGLRAAGGGDVIAYGGGTLVRSLIGAGLVDEVHLFVNPVAVGSGMAVFPQGMTPLRTVGVHPFACGITALHLEPAAG
ncbi:MAG: dihydrofolate reductase family protein [Miltoncostaeaceae bacterium]